MYTIYRTRICTPSHTHVNTHIHTLAEMHTHTQTHVDTYRGGTHMPPRTSTRGPQCKRLRKPLSDKHRQKHKYVIIYTHTDTSTEADIHKSKPSLTLTILLLPNSLLPINSTSPYTTTLSISHLNTHPSVRTLHQTPTHPLIILVVLHTHSPTH